MGCSGASCLIQSHGRADPELGGDGERHGHEMRSVSRIPTRVPALWPQSQVIGSYSPSCPQGLTVLSTLSSTHVLRWGESLESPQNCLISGSAVHSVFCSFRFSWQEQPWWQLEVVGCSVRAVLSKSILVTIPSLSPWWVIVEKHRLCGQDK